MQRMTTARVGLVGIVVLVVGMAGRGVAEEANPRPAAATGGWKEVDRLVSEQKLEAATAAIAKLRARARRPATRRSGRRRCCARPSSGWRWAATRPPFAS